MALVASLTMALVARRLTPPAPRFAAPWSNGDARRPAAVAMLEETDAASWAEDVEASDQLTVVYFYAPWCRACRATLPKLQRIEKKYSHVSFFQVNFKQETELCYQVCGAHAVARREPAPTRGASRSQPPFRVRSAPPTRRV